MPRLPPPVEHRFSKTNPPKNPGAKKGAKYFKCTLKKLMKGTIKVNDPLILAMTGGKIGKVIAVRHLFNALDGDRASIVDIMDRVDDENVTIKEDAGSMNLTNILIIRAGNNGNKIEEIPCNDVVDGEQIENKRIENAKNSGNIS